MEICTQHKGARTVLYRIADESYGPVLEVFGSTVEFLSRPSGKDNSLCVIRGVVPAGITVPLHSHEDAEDFYILAPRPPTPQDVERFVATCAKYGYVLGTPEDNAAVGIETPEFAAG